MEQIFTLLSNAQEGLSINELENGINPSPPRRTLQRWLHDLSKQGLVQVTGRSRGVRYTLVKKSETTKGSILLSQEGLEIERLVKRPLLLRNPVGYQAGFLESYVPNETFYLSKTDREHLGKIGLLPKEEGRPAGTYARQILSRLLIDLSWNSSRLEGNTYSLLETERLIIDGRNASGRAADETQMILNHKTAIEFLVNAADDIGFNRYTILNLHGALSNNLLVNPEASGRLRTIPVGISQTVYHPLEVPQLIETYFLKILEKATLISNPYEQAFFAMVHLPYLQPFEDVNKRVSRLALNIPFIKQNLCPVSFIDVPESTYVDGIMGVYELNRPNLLKDVFLWAYERSVARYGAVRASLGAPDLFRMRYHREISAMMREIILGKLSKEQTIQHIQQFARENVPTEDRARFVEVVEVELMSLHEGNIGRYLISLKEFNDFLRFK